MAGPKRRTSSLRLLLTGAIASAACVPPPYIPGGIRTELGRHLDAGAIDALINQINTQLAAECKGPFQWKTIPQGDTTSVWAGVVAAADEIGGRYCENCHVGTVVPDEVPISPISEGVRGYALDAKNAEALWKKSEELVGESF